MRKAHIMSVFKKGDGKILETTGLLHWPVVKILEKAIKTD